MMDAELAVDESQVTGSDFSSESGYLSAKTILESGTEGPLAFFALGNQIALGAISAIREFGLRVPDDISVITFDDQLYFELTDPAITTIQQPIKKIAEEAVRSLLEKMRGEEVSNALLNPKMIERASVRNLNSDL